MAMAGVMGLAESGAETKSGEPDLSKPLLGIDPVGNMTLFIPLGKTNEIFARGFVDTCRTEMIRWYVEHKARQAEIAALATKTGFQRFKDRLSNLGGK